MSCLYVTEQGSRLNVGQGNVIVERKDGSKRMIPSEVLESILIFGRVEVSTACYQLCMRKGIRVTFLSAHGHYFGHLEPTSFVNVRRLKQQVYLSDNEEQRLLFAQMILSAKVHNQIVLLRRYMRNSQADVSKEIRNMSVSHEKMKNAGSIEAVMGFEGSAAREYFSALSKIVRPEFVFCGRSKRPPKDAFNSLLSLGYTIVLYEIYAELEARGINPYLGFIHKIREHHPALVSDLLEEWRAVIVDAVVMSMISKKEVMVEEFYNDEESGGILIADSGVKTLVRNLEKKMRADMNYLDYLEGPVSFRRAIWWQTKSLAHCIDNNELSLYQPLRIR